MKDKTKELTVNQEFIETLDKRVRPLDRMIAMAKIGLETFQ